MSGAIDRTAGLTARPIPVPPTSMPAVRLASGMGFAVLETMGYGFVALLASRGTLMIGQPAAGAAHR